MEPSPDLNNSAPPESAEAGPLPDLALPPVTYPAEFALPAVTSPLLSGLPSRTPDRNPALVIRDSNPHETVVLRAVTESDADNNPMRTVASPNLRLSGLSTPPRTHRLVSSAQLSSIAAGGATDVSPEGVDPRVLAALESSMLSSPAMHARLTADYDAEPDPEPTEGVTSDVLRAMLRQANRELHEAQFWLSLLARECTLAQPLQFVAVPVLADNVDTLTSVSPSAAACSDESVLLTAFSGGAGSTLPQAHVTEYCTVPHSVGLALVSSVKYAECLQELYHVCSELSALRHPHVLRVVGVGVSGCRCAVLSHRTPANVSLHDVLSTPTLVASFTPAQRLLCVLSVARALLHVARTVTPHALAQLLPVHASAMVLAQADVTLPFSPWGSASVSPGHGGSASDSATAAATPSAAVPLWKLDLSQCVAQCCHTTPNTVAAPDAHALLRQQIVALGDVILQTVFGACDTTAVAFTEPLAVLTSALSELSRSASREGGTELLPDAVLDRIASVCDTRAGRWPLLLGESLSIIGVQARQCAKHRRRDGLTEGGMPDSAAGGVTVPADAPEVTLARVVDKLQALAERHITNTTSAFAAFVASRPAGVPLLW